MKNVRGHIASETIKNIHYRIWLTYIDSFTMDMLHRLNNISIESGRADIIKNMSNHMYFNMF